MIRKQQFPGLQNLRKDIDLEIWLGWARIEAKSYQRVLKQKKLIHLRLCQTYKQIQRQNTQLSSIQIFPVSQIIFIFQ